jgi:hypothetical protein
MDKERARQRALQYLSKLVPRFEEDFSIVDDLTMDAGWCWVFFWDSRKFLQTGALEDAIAGNAPVVVEKKSGEVHVTGTAAPLEDYLVKLQQQTD